MIEVEPWLPYFEDVRYPALTNSGEIALQDFRPDSTSPYTAGIVLDESSLDCTVPFGHVDGTVVENQRCFGVPIYRFGDTYTTYEAAEHYKELIAQMLGAIILEPGLEGDKLFYFNLHEELPSLYTDGMHHDSETNTPDDRAAIVSNLFQTYYSLQSIAHLGNPRTYTGVPIETVPYEALWCPRPKEITVHQGNTPHSVPIMPSGCTAVR
ncbi:hypothetical protein KC992_01845 [Candidatus Saccharibacteria bacterium]|nr:hypothetical protein [Candidatus Saccharibacteria bacterium]